MGGEGKSKIVGLAIEQPIAEVKELKPGLGSPRSDKNTALKIIAHTGDDLNLSTDLVNGRSKVQLKLSPQGSLDKKSKHSDNRGVSRDELDLMKSDLFQIKLERIEPKVGNQRHLCFEHVKAADSHDTEKNSGMDSTLSQPNHNPNYNPSDTPSDRLSLEDETDHLGKHCRGGGTVKKVPLYRLKSHR